MHAAAPASSISYAQVRYGGSWYNETVLVDGGSPTFNNVMIRDALSRGLAISGAAGGTYSKIHVERTGGTGMAASGSLATSLTDIQVAHTGRALGGGGWGNDGISVFGATTSLQSVQVSHVPGWAIDMPMSAWPHVTGLAIDATTSGHDGAVHVSGTLTSDCTPQADVTWHVEGLLDAGAQLTLLPGTVLKGSLIVVGTLDARGTAERPIVITGIGDDSVGGDTNDDNNASHPRESIGPRLRFFDTTSSGSVLDYVEVRYGGGRNGSGTPQAAVEIENASPRLSHVTIRDTDYWALLLKQDAGPTVEHLTIENCLGNGPSDGFGVYAQSDAGTFLLSDVSFRRVTNWPLYLADIDQWSRVTNVQVDATSCVRGASVYVAGGTLASDVRPAAGLAWQTDQITVPAGRTLTLDPATILKSTEPLNVFGVLYAHGTPAAPVILTVPTDDSAGGDTDGDGGAAAPQASGRGGLRVRAGGAATLTSTEVRYQGVSAVGGSLIVQASSVLHAPADCVQITESGTRHDHQQSAHQGLPERQYGVRVGQRQSSLLGEQHAGGRDERCPDR